MLASHQDAERRYHFFRQAVVAEVARELARRTQGLQVTLITPAALTLGADWRQNVFRRVDWDWLQGYRVFRYRHPKRFEMALWQGEQLLSLSLGRPTYNSKRARLDLVEANPAHTGETRIFPVVLLAIATYADMLGVSEVRVMHPVNAKVRRYYAEHGLNYVAKGDYMYFHV